MLRVPLFQLCSTHRLVQVTLSYLRAESLQHSLKDQRARVLPEVMPLALTVLIHNSLHTQQGYNSNAHWQSELESSKRHRDTAKSSALRLLEQCSSVVVHSS
jgi:hypothetical protein